MMIHWIVTASVPKLSVMSGSATFTVMSRAVRNIPDAAATSPIQRTLESCALCACPIMQDYHSSWAMNTGATRPELLANFGTLLRAQRDAAEGPES